LLLPVMVEGANTALRGNRYTQSEARSCVRGRISASTTC
jgi:hypothetical protein